MRWKAQRAPPPRTRRSNFYSKQRALEMGAGVRWQLALQVSAQQQLDRDVCAC